MCMYLRAQELITWAIYSTIVNFAIDNMTYVCCRTRVNAGTVLSFGFVFLSRHCVNALAFDLTVALYIAIWVFTAGLDPQCTHTKN